MRLIKSKTFYNKPWNNMVDEQARLESKTDKVKVFKVINGVYVEG